MAPFSAILVCLGAAIFGLLALLGERQFAAEERLPVYWGNGTRPVIFAQRRVALAIFPLFGMVLLLALAFAGQPAFTLVAAQLAVAACNVIFFGAIGRVLQQV